MALWSGSQEHNQASSKEISEMELNKTLQVPSSDMHINLKETSTSSEDEDDSEEECGDMCFISFATTSSEEEEGETENPNDASKNAVSIIIRKSIGTIDPDIIKQEEINVERIRQKEKNKLEKPAERKINEMGKKGEKGKESEQDKEEVVEEKDKSNEDEKIIYQLIYTIIPGFSKRGESFEQALSQDLLAEFLLYRKRPKQAGIRWIECLDCLFRKVCVLENFESLFESALCSKFVFTFGVRALQLAFMVLYKLGKFVYSNK